MLPTTRDEFIDLCKRNLGAPVLRINVADDQLDDRVDEALKYWRTFHHEAVMKVYLPHEIKEEEYNNRAITIDPSILSITRLAYIGEGNDLAASWMTNLGQSFRNLKWDLSFGIGSSSCSGMGFGSVTDYQLAMQYLQRLDNVFGSRYTNFEFKYHSHTLNIHADWEKMFKIGGFIVIEATKVLDPETYPDVWQDQWLTEYATALIGRQWGVNLSKFEGVELPGGITLDGDKIYDRYHERYLELRQEMIDKWELPPMFMVG